MSIAALLSGYELTVIPDDTQTPLAGAIPGMTGQRLFGSLSVILLISACVCLAVIYIHSCRKYQKRIRDLAGRYERNDRSERNWNILMLKQRVSDLECDVTEQMISHNGQI